jgi:hypothetical protein
MAEVNDLNSLCPNNEDSWSGRLRTRCVPHDENGQSLRSVSKAKQAQLPRHGGSPMGNLQDPIRKQTRLE